MFRRPYREVENHYLPLTWKEKQVLVLVDTSTQKAKAKFKASEYSSTCNISSSILMKINKNLPFVLVILNWSIHIIKEIISLQI